MMSGEYIRTNPEPSRSPVLSLVHSGKPACLTFLHAKRSVWPGNDQGRNHVAEKGHAHDVYHIVLFTGAANTIIHNGRMIPCARGNLIFTDPGTVHEYRPQTEGGSEFLEITFDLRTSSGAITLPFRNILSSWLDCSFPAVNWPLMIPPPHLEQLESMMDEILSELLAGGAFSETAASLALGRFLLELSRYLARDVRSTGSTQDKLEQTRLMIEKGFAGEMDIAGLASLACMSKGSYIRAFSRRFGSPPMAYRKQLRITAAKHLLALSGRSIGEIACSVGYRDIYAFSRSFSAEVGITAGQWRKKAR